MKMNFNFKELSVLVNGSSDLLYRVSRYFNDEVGLQIPDGKIVHIQEDDRNIEVDFKFPYNRVEVKECQEYNYYRYNTLVRKIFREGDSFKSISFVKNDEEAILKPFRELYFEKFGYDKALIHGSLLCGNIGGVLLVGPKRIGKSTLSMSLMEELGFSLVSDGLVVADKNLKGSYLPTAMYIRLYPFRNSKLFHLVNDIDQLESTQPLDPCAWKRIKKAGYWHIDENVTVSRKKYLEVMGVDFRSEEKVRAVIIPSYSPDHFQIERVSSQEMTRVVENQLLPKHSLVEDKVTDPNDAKVIKKTLEQIPAVRVSFGSKEDLTKQRLQRIIYSLD